MTPFEYFKKNPREVVEDMAQRAGSSYAYFEQIARGYRSPSIKKAKQFSKASGGAMTLEELIPELQDELQESA